MNCDMAQEKLPELLAGSLDRKTEQSVLAHLAACEECRRELAFWVQGQQAVLRGAEDAPGTVIREVRESLFGPGAASILDGILVTGRALGLAGSACRLALATMGVH